MTLSEFVELLKSVYAIIIYSILSIFPLFKLFERLLAFIENRKRVAVTIIENCMKQQLIKSDEIRKLCVESIDEYYFEKITGIQTESSQFRTALIVLHNKVSHSVKWKTIKNALPYLIVHEECTSPELMDTPKG